MRCRETERKEEDGGIKNARFNLMKLQEQW